MVCNAMFYFYRICIKVASMCRKGIRINIPEPYIGYYYGNVSEHGDVSRCPRKSSLFFLTILMSLESYCMEIGLDDW